MAKPVRQFMKREGEIDMSQFGGSMATGFGVNPASTGAGMPSSPALVRPMERNFGGSPGQGFHHELDKSDSGLGFGFGKDSPLETPSFDGPSLGTPGGKQKEQTPKRKRRPRMGTNFGSGRRNAPAPEEGTEK